MSDPDRTDTESEHDPTATQSGNGVRINRRTALRALGVSAASTTFVGAMKGTAVADGEYTTVEVSPNDVYDVRLGDGDTLENVLIDITNDGAGYRIIAQGDDWEIRNVGVRGTWDYAPNNAPFYVRVESPDATGVIENVYLGDLDDGEPLPHTWPEPTGLQVGPRHAGVLEIRNLNLQGFADNGLYASSPTAQADLPAWPDNVDVGYGEVRVYDSFFALNNNNVRIAGPGSFAQNCVSINPTFGKSCFYGYWGQGAQFVDCDAYAPGAVAYRSGTSAWHQDRGARCIEPVELENCRGEADLLLYEDPCGFVGDVPPDPNPRTDPPEGVPLSAEEAASGGGTTGTQPPEDDDGSPWDEDGENEIHVLSTDGDVAEYEVAVAGEADPGAHADTFEHEWQDSVECDDDGCTIHGYVAAIVEPGDDFRVSGSIETVDATENTQFLVNGVAVSHEELEGMGRPDDATKLLTIDEPGDRKVEYRFAVCGDVERSEENGATIDEWNVVENGTVDAHVWGGTDSYRFSGEVTGFHADGPVAVSLDGEEVTPSSFGSDLPTAITIESNCRKVEYEFTVSGDLEKTTDMDATLDVDDEIDGSTARGHVWGGRDSFRFDGEIEELQLSDEATVYVDGEEVDPDAL